MKTTSFSASGMILAIAYISFSPGAVFAQSAPETVSVRQSEKADPAKITFLSVVEQLRSRLDCVILAEGVPAVEEVNSEAVNPILNQQSIRLADAEKVVALFDYTLERHRDILLLRKRYTRPDDLPSVTLEECLDSVRDIQTVIAPFRSNMATGPISLDPGMKQCIKLFTNEQLERLSDKRGGLSLDSLSPAQRSGLWRLALHFYLGKQGRAIGAVEHQLASADKNELLFGWPAQYPHRVFGYTFPSTSGITSIFRPLSFVQGQISLDGGSFFNPVTPTLATSETEATGTKSATVHNAATSTLRELVESLNSRLAAQPEPIHVMVDDSLAAKPVYFVGGEEIAPVAIVQGIADLYGLRVVKNTKEEWRITRHKARPAQSPADIPEGVLAALPPPLLRAFTAASAPVDMLSKPNVVKSDTPSNVALPYETEPDTPAPIHYDYKQFLLAQKHRFAMRAVAAKRVRQAFDKRVQQKQQERIPIKETGQETHTAFAFVLMSDCLTEIEELLKPAPSYIREFDTTVFIGGLTGAEGNRSFTIEFGQRSTEGSVMQSGPGFTTLRYDKLDTDSKQ